MSCDRCEHFEPFIPLIVLPHLQEGLICVRCAGDEWRVRLDGAVARHPVEGITPAIFLKPKCAALLQLAQEMNGAIEMLRLAARFVKKSKAHRVVRIRDRETGAFVKEMPRHRKERLEENHRRDRSYA